MLFIVSGLSSIFFLMYIWKWLPETSQTVRLKEEEGFTSIPRQILLVAAAEILIVFSFGLTCGLVLDNYVYNVLSLSVFFIILVEVAISGTSILASFAADKADKKSRFINALYRGYFNDYLRGIHRKYRVLEFKLNTNFYTSFHSNYGYGIWPHHLADISSVLSLRIHTL
ncbi:MAG: hypothetical protein ACTSYM_04475 [Candidatus Baldrarchaeia archaeon]